MIAQIRTSTEAIAAELGVRGLVNIQFALSSDVLYVLEANPRASRTVPFVSKATGVPLAKAAARVMAGISIAQLRTEGLLPARDASLTSVQAPVAVKEAVLPFKRFLTDQGLVVDTVLGPEMRSTGEVMGFAVNFPLASAKSQSAAYGGLPLAGTVFVSAADRDKRALALPVSRLVEMGFTILATAGTASVLTRNGIPCTVVRKASDGPGPDGEGTIVDLIRAGQVDMVINTPGSRRARADGHDIRTATTVADRAIVTTMQQFSAAVQGIEAQRRGPFAVRALQEYARPGGGLAAVETRPVQDAGPAVDEA